MNKLKHIQEHIYESSDSSGDGEGEETDSLKEQLFLLRKLYLCKHFSEIDENMYQIEIGKNGFLIGKVSTMKETKTYWLSNEKTVIIKNQNTMELEKIHQTSGPFTSIEITEIYRRKDERTR